MTSQGQLVEEYNRFVSDTSLTSWKEFNFSPGSYDENNYLEYSAHKDLNSRIINEKLFDYYGGLEDWTITIYNKDWKIIEEIELNSDSSIIMKEIINYKEDGSIISECFDSNGNIDSTTNYTYYPDGTLNTYKYLIYDKDPSYHWYYGKYIKNINGKLIRKEVYSIDKNGKKTLDKYENYFYSNTQVDSIITFNCDNEIIEKKSLSYKNGKTDKVIYIKRGQSSKTEIYVYNNENLITILGYNKNYGNLRTIRIE